MIHWGENGIFQRYWRSTVLEPTIQSLCWFDRNSNFLLIATILSFNIQINMPTFPLHKLWEVQYFPGLPKTPKELYCYGYLYSQFHDVSNFLFHFLYSFTHHCRNQHNIYIFSSICSHHFIFSLPSNSLEFQINFF